MEGDAVVGGGVWSWKVGRRGLEVEVERLALLAVKLQCLFWRLAVVKPQILREPRLT